MTTRRLSPILALLVIGLTLVVAACGDKQEDKDASAQPQGDELVLTLGTKNFTESVVTGELYGGRGQAISEQTAFENVDAIATTQFFAQRRGLATVGDLRKLPRFTLGARPEFEERSQGLAGMRETYGLDNAEFKSVPIGEQYRALDRNEIDAANVFMTDGQLASGSYKVLEDTERVFGFQHAALVIDEDKLKSLGEPDFMRVINAVNRQLTTSAMIQMNRD